MLLDPATRRKQCSHCGTQKRPEEFHFYANSDDRLFPQCKACVAKRKSEKYAADKLANEASLSEAILRRTVFKSRAAEEEERERLHKAKIKKNREEEKLAKAAKAAKARVERLAQIEAQRLLRLNHVAKPPPLTRADKFWAKVDRRGSDECWLWKSVLNKNGYGRASETPGKYLLRRTSAHRRAWEYAKGAIPKGMWVLHRCDVRNCVNPDHLYLGTYQDNMNDMKRRGRHGYKEHPTPAAVPIRK